MGGEEITIVSIFLSDTNFFQSLYIFICLGNELSFKFFLNEKAITLNDLIASHQYETFDILQVDCEGFDGEVLKSLDFKNCRPKIIQFEHGHMSRMQKEEAAKLLIAAKYEFFYGGRQCDSLALSTEFASKL